MAMHYKELQDYAKSVLNSHIRTIKTKVKSNPSFIDDTSSLVFNQLVEDVTLEIVAEYHRAISHGYEDHIYPSKLDDNRDVEALGRESNSLEQLDKNVGDFNCPNCTQLVNACPRYAGHLENCMGIGRIRYRVPSRRIASNSKESKMRKWGHDFDTETEDTSTTPSPADSNSTSSGSASRRKDRVKPKRKVTKNNKYSDDQGTLILRC